LLEDAALIESVVEFNDKAHLESPEMQDAWDGYRAALLEEADAARALAAAMQEGDDYYISIAHWRTQKAIHAEEQAHRRFRSPCMVRARRDVARVRRAARLRS